MEKWIQFHASHVYTLNRLLWGWEDRENTIMEKEPNLENRTYEFIGRLALVLFSQNIKMSYSTLIKVLEDNNLDSYGSERGMASGIAAAYRRWEEIEKDCRIPTTCGAIANTFVNRDGVPEWINY